MLWALDAREVIARRIVDRRHELGLSQQQVAERGQLALRSYQRYEAGAVLPRKLARHKVAAALDLEADALEPPADPVAEVDDEDTVALVRQVLTRLTRIERALGVTDLEPDELAAEIAADEARRTR